MLIQFNPILFIFFQSVQLNKCKHKGKNMNTWNFNVVRSIYLRIQDHIMISSKFIKNQKSIIIQGLKTIKKNSLFLWRFYDENIQYISFKKHFSFSTLTSLQWSTRKWLHEAMVWPIPLMGIYLCLRVLITGYLWALIVWW